MGERRGLKYIWRTVPRAPQALFEGVRDVHPAMVQVMYSRGLTPAIVQELADSGAEVIITADCGSTSHAAADLARKLGVDLIVTDHHQCPPHLPNAYAVVNPWRPDCTYP